MPDTATATRWLVVLLVVGTAHAVLTWRSRLLGYRLSHQIMRDLQRTLGEHIGRLPLDWFAAQRIGPTARAVATSTFEIAGLQSHVLPELIDSIVMPATVVVVTFFIDARMAAALLVSVPVALRSCAGRAR